MAIHFPLPMQMFYVNQALKGRVSLCVTAKNNYDSANKLMLCNRPVLEFMTGGLASMKFVCKNITDKVLMINVTWARII
jgi:hypothetical protein